MRRAAYAAYNDVMINTTSKEKILLLLLDGAVKFVGYARRGIEENHIAVKGENISKALAIITELQCALDRKIGGELVENLDALYHYMMIKLTQANISNDIRLLDEVSKLLRSLKDGFESAVEEVMTPLPVQSRTVEPTIGARFCCAV